MKESEELRRQAELRLESSRRALEDRLAEIRTAAEAQLGFRPRNKLVLLLLAGAGGFALAWKLPRRRERRKLKS
jgi:hypothetical protein